MDEREYKEIEVPDKEDEDIEEDLREPFDPRAIDLVIEQRSLDSIMERIKHNEIDLNSEFRRQGNLWSPPVMSRLIESVLVRFPLPAFYFDASEDDRWLVVDGLQRLRTFKRFVVDCEEKYRDQPADQPLKLVGMEFLKDYEGYTFDQLPHNMQRRLRETPITAYFIKPGTPKEVKYSVFYRINTGGLMLNPQEIRNALNQNGPAPGYLKEISELPEFKKVVNISPKRMQDRELILRHLAFRLHPYETYKESMRSFLNDAMIEVNELSRKQLEQFQHEFISALEILDRLFGNHVFSKTLLTPQIKPTLNRGLFEVLTVLMAEMTQDEREKLFLHRQEFLEDFKNLLQDSTFDRHITSATAGSTAVKERFRKIGDLLFKYTKQ